MNISDWLQEQLDKRNRTLLEDFNDLTGCDRADDFHFGSDWWQLTEANAPQKLAEVEEGNKVKSE